MMIESNETSPSKSRNLLDYSDFLMTAKLSINVLFSPHLLFVL